VGFDRWVESEQLGGVGQIDSVLQAEEIPLVVLAEYQGRVDEDRIV
jgi:hypothetical protein